MNKSGSKDGSRLFKTDVSEESHVSPKSILARHD